MCIVRESAVSLIVVRFGIPCSITCVHVFSGLLVNHVLGANPVCKENLE